MSEPTGENPPRVRFAPSPTGFFHVGSGRTALWNWLVARRTGGTLVLRIEDTDTERNKEEWVDGIKSAMTWLGIDWDEGPYRQSERGELYREAIARLGAAGHTYACDCTREQIDERTKDRGKPGYDGHCRDRGLEPGPGRALRFRVPDEGQTVVQDLIRGDVSFSHDTIDDFVIVRSNGEPLFVLCVVVDDMEMRISHIIRGEEHLPTTPKAILIWEALGGPPVPAFAHVPLLVNEKRQKLSKRRDRVAMEDYRDNGILPDAMRNYLGVLGWSPADGREILTVEEMIAEFRVSDVNKSPAFFDEKRLAHFNGVYIRRLSDAGFIEAATPFVTGEAVPWASDAFDRRVFAEMAPLVRERIVTLAEVPGYVEFAFADPLVIDDASFEKALLRDPGAPEILQLAAQVFTVCPFETGELKAEIEAVGNQVGRKLAKVQAPIRVATMGRTVGLPLFESLAVLGRERAIARIGAALDRLAAAG